MTQATGKSCLGRLPQLDRPATFSGDRKACKAQKNGPAKKTTEKAGTNRSVGTSMDDPMNDIRVGGLREAQTITRTESRRTSIEFDIDQYQCAQDIRRVRFASYLDKRKEYEVTVSCTHRRAHETNALYLKGAGARLLLQGQALCGRGMRLEETYGNEGIPKDIVGDCTERRRRSSRVGEHRGSVESKGDNIRGLLERGISEGGDVSCAIRRTGYHEVPSKDGVNSLVDPKGGTWRVKD
ncbi:hypothetical protein K438DRAFT_1762352 [Mycena galopus ATCC 62051]|nr:hypothetical protein K438DRAFT_1762352 [Mycena galopus ATCC 62051]